MVKFRVSAPGRIVLAGEHSARYEKNLVVAGLDLRTKLEFEDLHESTGIISIDLPDVRLKKEILVQIFKDYFLNRDLLLSDVHTNPINLIRCVTYFISTNGFWKTCEQKFSLEIFFFLLYIIAYDKSLDIKPFRVKVFTEIPVGSGLGSSTSFAVCLAACFLRWKLLQSGQKDYIVFNYQELCEIERYTSVCEYYMQSEEFASIDATVCVRGKMRKYQRKYYISSPLAITDVSTEIEILLIAPLNVQNKGEDKEERAERMAKLKLTCPDFDSVIYELDVIANTIYDKLDYINSIRNVEDFMAHQNANQLLQEAIRRNQNLLRERILLHPDIDDISNIAASQGYGAKLTGFGGKFAYLVLPKKITRRIGALQPNIMFHYSHNRFITRLTTIDCDGVKIN